MNTKKEEEKILELKKVLEEKEEKVNILMNLLSILRSEERKENEKKALLEDEENLQLLEETLKNL